MKKISNFITKHNLLILIIGFILLIPAYIGMINTKINYNILMYLPKNIDTIKGEKILTEDFGLGAYAFVIVDTDSPKKILKLENKISKIDNVDKVFSLFDALGTTIPLDMLPNEIQDVMFDENKTIVFVTFQNTISSNETVHAVEELRKTVDAETVSSMAGLLIDIRNLSSKEISIYIIIATILCSIVLIFATDSYIMPLFLLGNIGIAILYNMGTNYFLGNISYVTKAISAILQLGVTTDFSIFLYHKYLVKKEEISDKREAMSIAIQETFKSVLGSSLTTFAGFLALCTMDLTLGTDIGVVMAKGVLFGLICVLTIFPSIILTFDKVVEKTKHKAFLPTFQFVQTFALKNYKKIIIVFFILFIPVLYGYSNYKIYYKLDEKMPDNMAFKIANKELAERFDLISPEIIIIDKNIKKNEVDKLVNEIKKMDNITFVLAPNSIGNETSRELLPKAVTDIIDSDKYQLIVLNSTYEIASDELNNQVEEIDKIVKKYDKHGIVAGEGPLMKDLVLTANHDFNMVNYTSMGVILIIMLFVLQSISLPIILIFAIEFAIYMNLAFAFYFGTTLPFVASIVVGTIQLGATIDYAILLSTKYLEEREKFDDKEEAMRSALSTSIPSIITSALSFFAATIGVALYTQIDMIGSICMLLARGSVISMFVVVLVLPSLLLLFDKIILKTTRKTKEEI